MVEPQKITLQVELIPFGPVRHRAHPCRSDSTVHKSFDVESLLAPEHVINGAS